MFFYDQFSADKLREAPRTQVFKLSEQKDNLNVHYLAFSQQASTQNAPIIILSGAFQSFSSFEIEVKHLTETHPVIILEMPSQGSNTQLVEDFSLEDYAKLLHQFVQHNALTKVNLIGLSYGSAMALLYATLYPNYCERLLLSGITYFKRNDILPLLEDSLRLLHLKDMKAYASLALCNLINHNHLDKTGISKAYRRLLYRQINHLSDDQRDMHIKNTQRLMEFGGFSTYPSCKTLVVAGEFDNFTQPDEQVVIAKHCPNASFAIIHNSDHLVQLEQAEAMTNLGRAFFNETSLDNVEGVSLFTPENYEFNQAKMAPVIKGLNLNADLIQPESPAQPVKINELNVSQFTLQYEADKINTNQTCKLAIEGIEHPFDVHLLDTSNKDHHLSGIFSHQNMDATNRLIKLIETVK